MIPPPPRSTLFPTRRSSDLRVVNTSLHLAPVPTSTRLLLASYWTALMCCRSMVTPPSMLDAPAYGVCPPLRIANLQGSGNETRILITWETSFAFLGCTTQLGDIDCCLKSKYESRYDLYAVWPGKSSCGSRVLRAKAAHCSWSVCGSKRNRSFTHA